MKNIKLYIVSILCLLVLSATFIISQTFTDPFETPKYFYISILSAILLFLFFLKNIFTPNTELRIDILDLSIYTYAIFIILRTCLQQDFPLHNVSLNHLLLSVLTYSILKCWLRNSLLKIRFQENLTIIFTITCYAQVIYGILQYLDILPTHQNYFNISGAYGNPGPYSLIITLLFPFALLFGLNRLKANNLKSVVLNILPFLFVLLVLILSKSRTSWIAYLVSSAFILFRRYYLFDKLLDIIRSKWLRVSSILISLFVLTLLIIATFNFKPESANGRILIWKISMQMIEDKPLLGHGYDMFAPAYNNYQAKYFAQPNFSEQEAFYASHGTYAFNEFIQIGVESGIVGIILFCVIILAVVLKVQSIRKYGHTTNPFISASLAVLLVFIISMLFTYPLRIIPIPYIVLSLIAFISVYSKGYIFKISIHPLVSRLLFGIMLVPMSIFIVFQINLYHKTKEWDMARNYLYSGSEKGGIEKYEILYRDLKHNQYFLYNYGAELSLLGYYEEGNKVLHEAETKINDSDLYAFLGNNYELLGQHDKAIQYFIHSSNIMPIKFYPKYRLVKLYLEQGEKESALILAEEILSMPVKVESDLVENIKLEMHQFVSTEKNRVKSLY